MKKLVLPEILMLRVRVINRLIRFGVILFFSADYASAQFFDDFDGSQLDTNRWVVMQKAWGIKNGGVVRENVSVSDGVLHLTGHGDLYTGLVQGVDRKGHQIDRVTRVGAALYTSNYYASGKYEVRLKLPSHLGACSAIWTFHYEEAYPSDPLYPVLARVGGLSGADLSAIGLSPLEIAKLLQDITSAKEGRPPYLSPPTNGIYRTTQYFRRKVTDIGRLELAEDFGKNQAIFTVLKNAASLQPQGTLSDGQYLVRNQEIDIETPTGLKSDLADISYAHDRFNTWIGEDTGEYTDNFDNLGQAMNDGQFHVFRIDWHTGSSNGPDRRVEFYIDDKCYQTNYTHIPTIGGRFTLGLWFPTWAGKADFATESLDVDWVRISPFHESGDQWVKETE
jgi:beta-glucanase (GH16 family)